MDGPLADSLIWDEKGRRKAGKIALLFSPTIDLLFDNHINVPVPKYTTLWNSSLMAGLVGCAVVDIHSSFTGFRLLAAACQKRSIVKRKTGKFALSLSPTIDLPFDNHINVRVSKYTTLHCGIHL